MLEKVHLHFTVRKENFTVRYNFSVLEKKNSLLEVNTVKKLFSSVLVRDKNTVTKLTVKQIYISVLGKDQYSVRKNTLLQC